MTLDYDYAYVTYINGDEKLYHTMPVAQPNDLLTDYEKGIKMVRWFKRRHKKDVLVAAQTHTGHNWEGVTLYETL